MQETDIEIINSDEPKEPCWPFWGNLKSQGKSAYDKHGWNHSIITTGVLQADIFDRFYRVGSNALRMLKHRSITEMRLSAEEIQAAISEWFEQYIEAETEERVQRIAKNGGWELGYLPVDSRGTVEEIRHLLTNWSNDWERLKLPSRDDFDDLFALSECVEDYRLEKNELVYLGFCEPEIHEIFALLAVMLICEAVNSHMKASQNFNSLHRVKSLALATIEAVEALAYAEKLQLEEKVRNSISQKQPEILEKELSKITSARAKNAANFRFQKNNEARAWVQSEWQLHKDGYQGNKSEFSRAYTLLVRNKFTNINGDPLSITDKTIREIWLRDTPNARN